MALTNVFRRVGHGDSALGRPSPQTSELCQLPHACIDATLPRDVCLDLYVKVLKDADERMHAKTPWYTKVALEWEGEEDGHAAEIDVETVLAFNISNGAVHVANEPLIVPVIMVFKDHLDAAKAAVSLPDEALELVKYCVGISTHLVEFSREEGMPQMIAMAFGEFKEVMESVIRFFQEHCGSTSTRDCYCSMSTITTQKPKLEGLLRTVFDGARRYVEAMVESPAGRRPRLTFVSHAGEEKGFARSLLRAIEDANVAAFFDDDMALGTSSIEEMTSRAEEADQAVVVLPRAFLTKEWPMKELHIFLDNRAKNKTDILPLYYKVTPDELWDIITDSYDR